MNAIILASSEAITNIIRHAHRNQPGAICRLQMRFLPDLVEILLYDQGDPFDIAAVPQLDPAELRVGGRGVYLMRALMDDLSLAAPAGPWQRSPHDQAFTTVSWGHVAHVSCGASVIQR